MPPGLESTAHGVWITERRPRWTFAQQSQDVLAGLTSIRELIASVPSPCSDHRKNKSPTLLEQVWVDIRIKRADAVRHVGNIEFDGAAATRFEVDEHRSDVGAENVARMRLAV